VSGIRLTHREVPILNPRPMMRELTMKNKFILNSAGVIQTMVLAVCFTLTFAAGNTSARLKLATLGDLRYGCGEEERLKGNEFANPNAIGFARGFCDGIISLAIDMYHPWCVPPERSFGDVKQLLQQRVSQLTDKQTMAALIADEPPTVFLHKVLAEEFPCE
jgi:hypothetical protein